MDGFRMLKKYQKHFKSSYYRGWATWKRSWLDFNRTYKLIENFNNEPN